MYGNFKIVKVSSKYCDYLRKYDNKTIKEFSKTLNVSEGTIYSWETGQRIPKLELLVNICNMYHVSLDSFVLYE